MMMLRQKPWTKWNISGSSSQLCYELELLGELLNVTTCYLPSITDNRPENKPIRLVNRLSSFKAAILDWAMRPRHMLRADI